MSPKTRQRLTVDAEDLYNKGFSGLAVSQQAMLQAATTTDATATR
jgi:hypothetical protein